MEIIRCTFDRYDFKKRGIKYTTKDDRCCTDNTDNYPNLYIDDEIYGECFFVCNSKRKQCDWRKYYNIKETNKGK